MMIVWDILVYIFKFSGGIFVLGILTNLWYITKYYAELSEHKRKLLSEE